MIEIMHGVGMRENNSKDDIAQEERKLYKTK